MRPNTQPLRIYMEYEAVIGNITLLLVSCIDVLFKLYSHFDCGEFDRGKSFVSF